MGAIVDVRVELKGAIPMAAVTMTSRDVDGQGVVGIGVEELPQMTKGAVALVASAIVDVGVVVGLQIAQATIPQGTRGEIAVVEGVGGTVIIGGTPQRVQLCTRIPNSPQQPSHRVRMLHAPRVERQNLLSNGQRNRVLRRRNRCKVRSLCRRPCVRKLLHRYRRKRLPNLLPHNHNTQHRLCHHSHNNNHNHNRHPGHNLEYFVHQSMVEAGYLLPQG